MKTGFVRFCLVALLFAGAVLAAVEPMAAGAEGDVVACERLYEAKKYDEAFPFCKRAAEAGEVAAQYNLGEMYEYGRSVERDDREAARWYRLAAEQGDADAQYILGIMYHIGAGMAQDYREAVKWFRLAAEQGHAEAQHNLGGRYEYGEGVAQDYREAVKWYHLAAEQGHASAQHSLGGRYEYGEGVAQDYREAVKWYRLSAEQGYYFAQSSLGSMYYYGDGVDQDYHVAMKWYRLAADQGDAWAQYSLGGMYFHGQGVITDYREAFIWYTIASASGKLFGYTANNVANNMKKIEKQLDSGEIRLARAEAKKRLEAIETDSAAECGRLVVAERYEDAFSHCKRAAEQGIAPVQYILGAMYHDGDGVAQDYREAVKWFRQAAAQGLADAQYNLGVAYANGKGVAQDKRAAAKWYRLAAEQGNAAAQNNLGLAYTSGDGVSQNMREAVKWFHLAAEQGHAWAQYNLGVAYANGKGAAQDKREAAKWYRLAAEQGHARAQYNLGVMYAKGEGVIEDVHEGYIWFLIAAAGGHEKAVTNRGVAENKLTASEIRSAKSEAKKRLAAIEARKNSAAKEDTATPSSYLPAASEKATVTPAQTAFENVWRSVVLIETDDAQGGGVIVRPNIVATNCHVIEGAKRIYVYKAVNQQADKTVPFSASIRGFNFERDLCLLDVAGLNGTPAQVRNADSLVVGESVYAVGAPQGLDLSLSGGVVSQLRRDGYGAPIIQTDAAISYGSSGGGLADGNGYVVGITTLKWVEEGAEGIAFAVPIEWVLEMLE